MLLSSLQAWEILKFTSHGLSPGSVPRACPPFSAATSDGQEVTERNYKPQHPSTTRRAATRGVTFLFRDTLHRVRF